MSIVLRTPAQAPATIRHADTPERWDAALIRAKQANVKVYALTRGGYADSSSHESGGDHEATTRLETCSCPAAQGEDAVYLHREAVRELLRPQSEPPASQAYDPAAEQLQWAYNDRDRAYRDLEK